MITFYNPANANDPNSEDSQGKAFFVKTVRIGTSGDYPTLQEAFPKIINEYGDNGNGRRVAILLLSNYAPTSSNDSFIILKGENNKADLSWISIFSEGNSFINFNNAILYFVCDYTPIINFKMSMIRGSSNISKYGFYISNSGATSSSGVTVTFGKNANIIFRNTFNNTQYNSTFLLYGTNMNIIAQYGITINSTHNLTYIHSSTKYLINKGNITYEQTIGDINHAFMTGIGTSKIYNSTFYCNTGKIYSLITTTPDSDVYLQNVESSDRTGNTKGIVVGGKCTLNNCRFASSTSGTQDSGIDIVIGGNSTSRIILDSATTGNTNQAIDAETTKGKIIRTTT